MNSHFTVTPGEHSSKYIWDQMNSALLLESKKRSNYFRLLACSNQQHFDRGMIHEIPKKMKLRLTLTPSEYSYKCGTKWALASFRSLSLKGRDNKALLSG
jgi:hypothetical protein